MQPNEDDLCPCGSGAVYKNCHMPNENNSIVLEPTKKPDNPKPIRIGGISNGKPWSFQTDKLPFGSEIVIHLADTQFPYAPLSEEIAFLKQIASYQNRFDLASKLDDCQHKLQAVSYHLASIQREISDLARRYNSNYKPHAGMVITRTNFLLIYETEAFLFQVKSSLDLAIQALTEVTPALKGKFDALSNTGKTSKNNVIAGGAVIERLRNNNEKTLSLLFESHRVLWLQQLVEWRDTITHISVLKGFQLFEEGPYEDGKVVIRYPVMPSGMRVDAYCQDVQSHLIDLYKELLGEIKSRLMKKVTAK